MSILDENLDPDVQIDSKRIGVVVYDDFITLINANPGLWNLYWPELFDPRIHDKSIARWIISRKLIDWLSSSTVQTFERSVEDLLQWFPECSIGRRGLSWIITFCESELVSIFTL